VAHRAHHVDVALITGSCCWAAATGCSLEDRHAVARYNLCSLADSRMFIPYKLHFHLYSFWYINIMATTCIHSCCICLSLTYCYCECWERGWLNSWCQSDLEHNMHFRTSISGSVVRSSTTTNASETGHSDWSPVWYNLLRHSGSYWSTLTWYTEHTSETADWWRWSHGM